MKKVSVLVQKLNSLIRRLDTFPLEWCGIVLFVVVFLPFLILGKGSVFTIHDQLDETLMTYVLNARHLFDRSGIIPETLGGINASGMQPSAVLFLPLYAVFDTFTAFLIQYAVVFLAGFFGMYFCVKEITGSSILALTTGGIFCMLPVLHVYGLSVFGIPMVLYAFLCLVRGKKTLSSMVFLLIFGLTSHLVLTGYCVLGFWLLYLIWDGIFGKRRRAGQPVSAGKRGPLWGFVLLLVTYLAVNHSLFTELLLGKSSYVSHREELVNGSMPFAATVKDVFLNSAQHAESLHKLLILPILGLLLWGAYLYRRFDRESRCLYRAAVAGMVVLAGIALLYGLCRSEPVAAWKNSVSGFFRYFQLERFYWMYPAGWYLEFALCFGAWWRYKGFGMPLLKTAVLVALLLPTVSWVKEESLFYRNVNQINNGSGVTGYITWEAYYSEDLMQQIEDTIGRDMTEYRVAHLGMNTAPALLHGFYTVDGYSNNYPLEYKHAFRRVIAAELDKNEQTAGYFDAWGGRAYLFNHVSGTYWQVGKKDNLTYEQLDFDMEALKELGCEYLFSAGEIVDADRMGLEPMGYFDTQESYWGIWLYRLK